ncbi:NAD(+) diphosphatase [Entamoeba marina]
MERLESIRDCETSNNMNTLIPYLKTLTPSKVTFISFSQDLKVNIRNESCLFDEFEIGSLEQTLLVYCGTTKDTHYVATITTTNPTETKQLTTFESMRLSREICDIIGYSSSLLKFNTLFNYCPKCGSKMSYAGFGNHQKCVECNNVNFPKN